MTAGAGAAQPTPSTTEMLAERFAFSEKRQASMPGNGMPALGSRNSWAAQCRARLSQAAPNPIGLKIDHEAENESNSKEDAASSQLDDDDAGTATHRKQTEDIVGPIATECTAALKPASTSADLHIEQREEATSAEDSALVWSQMPAWRVF